MCYLGIASPDSLPTTRKFGSGARGLLGLGYLWFGGLLGGSRGLSKWVNNGDN